MTPDEIQKDRAAGTPGPWAIGSIVIGQRGGLGFVRHVVEILWKDQQGEADARRIARVPELEGAYLALAAENAALKERVAELEDALEPFARRADTYDPPEDDDWVVDWYDSVDRPTLGNFRLARAALEKRHDRS